MLIIAKIASANNKTNDNQTLLFNDLFNKQQKKSCDQQLFIICLLIFFCKQSCSYSRINSALVVQTTSTAAETHNLINRKSI